MSSRLPALFARFLVYGVFWGWTCMAAVMSALWLAAGSEALDPILHEFSRQMGWAAVAGTGFTLPAILYRFERPAPAIKILIHFGVGMGIFFPVAFSLGWIPDMFDTPAHALAEVAIGTGIFFVIWVIFYIANRHEAKQMNARIRELQEEIDGQEPSNEKD